MFCKNCGFQNAEGTKFCVSCGTNLTEDTQQAPKPNATSVDVHNSVIRKSIKKAAKSKPKGALIGGFFLYILIIMALVLVLSLTLFNTAIDPSVTNVVAVIIVALLMAIAGIGWASICALPFAMLSQYIKPGTEGSVMGIFNIFIAGPQVFVCTLVAWFISKCIFTAGFIYKIFQHCLSYFKISNDTVFHWSNSYNVARSTANHAFGIRANS